MSSKEVEKVVSELKIPDSFKHEIISHTLTQAGPVGSEALTAEITGLRIFLNTKLKPDFISFVSVNIYDCGEFDKILEFATKDDEGKVIIQEYKFSEFENGGMKKMFLSLRDLAYSNYLKSVSNVFYIHDKENIEEWNVMDNFRLNMLPAIILAENMYRILNDMEPVKINLDDLSADFIFKVGILKDYDLSPEE